MSPLLVAVSGGVDSVVLLDIVAKTYEPDRIIVAHFEHGIRGNDSKNDAQFVYNLSQKYRLKCIVYHGNLSKKASEDEARRARYEFLRRVAREHEAQLVTAHHLDDIVGSIAINIHRGTGWRGLAVMNAQDVVRPLRSYTKADILRYAARERLEFVEDETNCDQKVLRNRLRPLVVNLPKDTRKALLALSDEQRELGARIDAEALTVMPGFIIENSVARYGMTMIDEQSALELLQVYFRNHGGAVPRPALRRLLMALKTLRPGAQHDVVEGISLQVNACGATIRSSR